MIEITTLDSQRVHQWVWTFSFLSVSNGIIWLITMITFYKLIQQAANNYYGTHHTHRKDTDSSNETISKPDDMNHHSPPAAYNHLQQLQQKRKFSLRIFIVIILVMIYVFLRATFFGYSAYYVEKYSRLPEPQSTPVFWFFWRIVCAVIQISCYLSILLCWDEVFYRVQLSIGRKNVLLADPYYDQHASAKLYYVFAAAMAFIIFIETMDFFVFHFINTSSFAFPAILYLSLVPLTVIFVYMEYSLYRRHVMNQSEDNGADTDDSTEELMGGVLEEKQALRKQLIILRRVSFLSVVCVGLFTIRGIINCISAVEGYNSYGLHNKWWSFLMYYFSLEFLPVIMMLAVLLFTVEIKKIQDNQHQHRHCHHPTPKYL